MLDVTSILGVAGSGVVAGVVFGDVAGPDTTAGVVFAACPPGLRSDEQPASSPMTNTVAITHTVQLSRVRARGRLSLA